MLAEAALSSGDPDHRPRRDGARSRRSEGQLPATARGRRSGRARAHGEVIHAGRRIAVANSEVLDADGTPDRRRHRLRDAPARPSGVARSGGGVIRRRRFVIQAVLRRDALLPAGCGARLGHAPIQTGPRQTADRRRITAPVTSRDCDGERGVQGIIGSRRPRSSTPSRKRSRWRRGCTRSPSLTAELPRADRWLDVWDRQRLHQLQRPGRRRRRAAERRRDLMEFSRFLVFETSLRLSSTPPFPGFQSELAKLRVVASRVGTSRRRVYNGKHPVHDGQPVAACEAARVVDNLPSDSRSVAGDIPGLAELRRHVSRRESNIS